MRNTATGTLIAMATRASRDIPWEEVLVAPRSEKLDGGWSVKMSEGLTGNGSTGEGSFWHAYSMVLRTRDILLGQRSSLAREECLQFDK